MRVLLSPHNDDESLFAAYTIMRERPLVVLVTDSDLQPPTTSQEQREESRCACEIMGVRVEFLGLKDGCLPKSEPQLRTKLQAFEGPIKVRSHVRRLLTLKSGKLQRLTTFFTTVTFL